MKIFANITYQLIIFHAHILFNLSPESVNISKKFRAFCFNFSPTPFEKSLINYRYSILIPTHTALSYTSNIFSSTNSNISLTMKSTKAKKRNKSSYSKKKRTTYRCSHCKDDFSSFEHLKQHVLDESSHPECMKSVHPCKFCDELYYTPLGLRRHIQMSVSCSRLENLDDNVNTVDYKISSNLEITENLLDDDPITEVHHEDHISGLVLNLHQPSLHHHRSSSSKVMSTARPAFDSSINRSNLLFSLNIEDIRKDLSSQWTSCKSYSSRNQINLFSHLVDLLSQCIGTENGIFSGTFHSFLLQTNNVSFEQYSHIHDLRIDQHDAFHFFEKYKLSHIQTYRHDNSDVENLLQPLNAHDQHDFHNDDNSESNHSMANIDQVLNHGLIDESILNFATNVQKQRDKSIYTERDHAMLALEEILGPISPPLYIFNQLTEWCQHYSGAFGQAGEMIPSREKFIKNLSNLVYGSGGSEEMKPKQVSLKLHDDDDCIPITKFSFTSNIFSLLSNPEFMTEENLLINPNNPYQLPDDNGTLDDINSGWWFKETHQELCTGPTDILLPILIFIDGGKITERISIEPLVLTLGIFKRSLRNLPSSWRTLGYLENLDNSTGTERVKRNAKKKMHDYHEMLKEILSEFKLHQGKNGGFKWKLKIGNHSHEVVFKLAIQVVLGDCVGHDKLCLHIASNNSNAKNLCRECKVSPTDSEDPDHRCIFITADDFLNASQEDLANISKRNVPNAFSDIYFGARNLSIYESTPPEPLHQFLLGLVKYLIEELFKEFTEGLKKRVSKCVQHLYKNCSRQSSRNFPSLACVQNSITNTGTLSASEQYIRLFALFIAFNIPEVYLDVVTTKRADRSSQQNTSYPHPGNASHQENTNPLFSPKDPITRHKFNQWISLIEESLCFYQWIMSPTHKKATFAEPIDRDGLPSDSIAQGRIRQYMRRYSDLCKEREKNGLRIPKFHTTLHYARQVSKDGSILNIDTGRPESNAVSMYKKPSRNTQRRQQSVVKQVADRHYENLLFQEARRLSDYKKKKVLETNVRRDQSSRYKLQLKEMDEDQHGRTTVNLEMKWTTRNSLGVFANDIMLSLCKRLFLIDQVGYGCISEDSIPIGFTEYVDKDRELFFRAHPNYRGNGAWFDWCTIRWENIDDPIPAKIITFIDLSGCAIVNDEDLLEHNPNGYVLGGNINIGQGPYLTNSKWVLVRSGRSDNEVGNNHGEVNRQRNSFDSNIVKRMVLENTCRLLPIESIESHCYCIPETNTATNDTCDRFMYFTDIKEWGQIFLRDT